MVEVEALSTDAGLYALAVRENSLSDRTTIPGLRFEVTLIKLFRPPVTEMSFANWKVSVIP